MKRTRPNDSDMDRRGFLRLGTAAGAGLLYGLWPHFSQAAPQPVIDAVDSEFELLVPGVVVLSASDFAAAIGVAQLCGDHERPCWAPVDAGMAEEAAIVAGVANNPDTIAIVARLHRRTEPGRVLGLSLRDSR